MHRDVKAEAGTDNPDRQAQIPGGANGNTPLAEKLAQRRGGKAGVVIRLLQQPGIDGQLFRMRQHFIDAAAGFDRTRHRQMAVFLQPQTAWQRVLIACIQHRLQVGQRADVRLNDAVAGARLRKYLHQVRGKTRQPGAGVRHLFTRQANVRIALCQRGGFGVEPGNRL